MKRLLPGILLLLTLALLFGPTRARGQSIFLPGTQPKKGELALADRELCKPCHAPPPGDPQGAWNTGLMAHAGQDPVFRAALAIADQDVPGVSEYCMRCHAPRGWVDGRVFHTDGSDLGDAGLSGVTCNICHRLVDPMSEEAADHVDTVPPGYGNGMLVLDTRLEAGEATARDPEFQRRSEFCAPGHEFSNPHLARDPVRQPPHEYGPLARTYSEWLSSDYPSMGPSGTCQGCHFPPPFTAARVGEFATQYRPHFMQMGALGPGIWAKQVLVWLYGNPVEPRALAEGVRRSRAFLRTAAELELTPLDAGKVRVVVRNRTGHKLPTGYPEGKRVWLNLRFLDDSGELLRERGAFGPVSTTLRGEPVVVSDLIAPEGTRIYEVRGGQSRSQAARHGTLPGESYHLMLNDEIVRDTRIPPQGFTNAGLARRKARPVRRYYPDGQNYDIADFWMPRGTARIEARLLHQAVSWDYVRFLVENNTTNDAGDKLWEVYQATGMCPPELLAEASIEVDPPTSPEIGNRDR